MRIPIAVATAWANVGSAFAQLRPDSMVDRNLIRTRRLLAAEDFGTALAELDANITIPEKHDREAPDGFRFKNPNWLSLQQDDDLASGAQLPRNTHQATAKAGRATGRWQTSAERQCRTPAAARTAA